MSSTKRIAMLVEGLRRRARPGLPKGRELVSFDMPKDFPLGALLDTQTWDEAVILEAVEDVQ